MENLSHHTAEPSVRVLLGGIVNDAKDLLAQEVTMLKLEARDDLRKAKSTAITLGTGIGIVAAGGMFFGVMLVQGLAVFTMIPLWGCYGVVGSSLVALGGVWLAMSRSTAANLTMAPQQRVKTRKDKE